MTTAAAPAPASSTALELRGVSRDNQVLFATRSPGQ
jgi:hypothetical protein